jgi:hypothetical protein
MRIWLNRVTGARQRDGLRSGIRVANRDGMFNIRNTLHQKSDSSDSDAAVTGIDEQKATHTYHRCNDPVVGHCIGIRNTNRE